MRKMNCCSSASEVAAVATRWLDPPPTVNHEPEMRRSVSDNGPTGSDGVPSDTTEDDWSRGSAEDPDEVPSPLSSPSPSPAEPPEHTGPITELDRKVRLRILRTTYTRALFTIIPYCQSFWNCVKSLFDIKVKFIELSLKIL